MLLVDDNTRLLFALRQGLLARLSGVVVEACEHFATASNLIDTREYDAIVTDIVLLDGDGLELVKHARRDQPHVPVILITGVDDDELATKAVLAGAFDLIFKPVDLDHLARSVGSALRRRRIKRELMLG